MTVYLLWSRAARRDLRQIYRYLADESEPAATRLYREITSTVEMLRAHPRMGSPRPLLGEKARVLVCGAYLVLYDVTADHDRDAPADRVEIVRVLHGRRDLPRQTRS